MTHDVPSLQSETNEELSSPRKRWNLLNYTTISARPARRLEDLIPALTTRSADFLSSIRLAGRLRCYPLAINRQWCRHVVSSSTFYLNARGSLRKPMEYQMSNRISLRGVGTHTSGQTVKGCMQPG